MEKFKIQLDLAERYYSGNESHWSFSKDMAEECVKSALKTLDLSLPHSMSVDRKIQWLKALN